MVFVPKNKRRWLNHAVDSGIFLDSWGGFWRSCRASERGSVAFGPTGTAKPAIYRGRGRYNSRIDLVVEDDETGFNWILETPFPSLEDGDVRP